MKKSRLLIAGAIAAALPLAGAFAQTPTPDAQSAAQSQPAQGSQQKGATFESLDTNGDGRISQSEAAVDPNVSDQFAKYDKNGDGFIERDEVTATNHTPPSDSPSKQP
jgi:Ca2+-binding EF-hand superfamily protein